MAQKWKYEYYIISPPCNMSFPGQTSPTLSQTHTWSRIRTLSFLFSPKSTK
jgi:hypothetical protein